MLKATTFHIVFFKPSPSTPWFCYDFLEMNLKYNCPKRKMNRQPAMESATGCLLQSCSASRKVNEENNQSQGVYVMRYFKVVWTIQFSMSVDIASSCKECTPGLDPYISRNIVGFFPEVICWLLKNPSAYERYLLPFRILRQAVPHRLRNNYQDSSF